MKWAGLVVLLFGTFALSAWLRGNRDGIPKILTLMGFLPFGRGPFHLGLAPISWEDWPGYAKGTEVTVLDALAIALYTVLPPLARPVPFRLPMVIYFLVVLSSVLQAQEPEAALFYALQLIRVFVVYMIVVKACLSDSRSPLALLAGMGAGLAMEAAVAVWERLAHGAVQAGGTVGSQNLLGLMSHLIVFPCFALLLAGRGGRAPAAITFTGLIAEVLTTSRATVGVAGAAYAITFVLSAARQWTPRKAMMLIVGCLMVAVATPIVISSFEQRFSVEKVSDYDERAAFLTAAQTMLADHPLGVGANHYVLIANIEGYNERAGVAMVETSLAANVHNVYMLVAAETGYLGLVAYVFVLLAPLWMAARYSWRYRRDESGDLLLGLTVALLALYVHSAFEWSFITAQVQYLWAFDVGLVAALAQPAVSRASQHAAFATAVPADPRSMAKATTAGGTRRPGQ